RSLRILRGDASAVLKDLRAQMQAAAEGLQFERAQALKLQLEALQSVGEKQTVAGGEGDEDALGLHRAGNEVTAAFLQFRDAALGADIDSRRRTGAERLARLLGLPAAPHRLHCLDVSTIQGTNTVASRVCFVDGAPSKAHYRRFRIPQQHAGDDFAAMQDAVR